MWKFPVSVCVCVEVLRVLLELQFELGNGDLSFCYNFWYHRKEELDISYDSISGCSLLKYVSFHIYVLNRLWLQLEVIVKQPHTYNQSYFLKPFSA